MKNLIDYIKKAWHFYRVQEKCNLYHSIKWTIEDFVKEVMGVE